MARYKVNWWLLSLARGQQSVIIYFRVGKFRDSGVAISVSSRVPVVKSVRQLQRYLMGCARNSHSAETDSGSRKHDIRLTNKKYLRIRIALNWNNRIEYIRPPSWCRERLSHSERKALTIALRSCVLLFSRGTLFNTLAIYTSILSTYSLFWNSYVNLPMII